MERVKGIEPSSIAWEATVLPLYYTRKIFTGLRFVASLRFRQNGKKVAFRAPPRLRSAEARQSEGELVLAYFLHCPAELVATDKSSTVKCRVAFGGIMEPAPFSP